VCSGARWETPGENCRKANWINPGAEKQIYGVPALAQEEYLPLCSQSIHETPGVSCRKPNWINPGAEKQIYDGSSLAQKDQEYLPRCTKSIHETPGVSCRNPNAVNPGAEAQDYNALAESHIPTCTGARWETPGENCRKANTFNQDVDYMYHTHMSTLAQAGDLPPCKAESNYNKRQIPGHTCWIAPTGSAPSYPSAGGDEKKEKKASLAQGLPYCTGVSNERVGTDCKAYPDIVSTFAQMEDLPPCKAESNYNKRQIPGHTCWIKPLESAPGYPSIKKAKEEGDKKESLVQMWGNPGNDLPYCAGNPAD
jgi:hypothetical protein